MSVVARMPWSEPGPPSEATLRARLVREGFDVMVWSDPAGTTYEPHEHPHDESLWGVRGEIVFTIAGDDYVLGPGDRLTLPRGTTHSAQVGVDGATYLIGQR